MPAEREHKRRIIDAIPERMARRLETIWCGSDAASRHTATARPGFWVPNLGQAIADAV